MPWGRSRRRLGAARRGLGCLALGTACGLLACGDKAQTEGRLLVGDEIRALFSDKTVRGHHALFDYDFRSYYEALPPPPSEQNGVGEGDDPTARRGRFRSHQSDKARVRAAQWWVVDDRICVRWDDRAEDLCRHLVDTGAAQGRYRKVRIRGEGRQLVVTFKSFEDGNPEGL